MNRNTRNTPVGRGADSLSNGTVTSTSETSSKAKKSDPPTRFGGLFGAGTIALLISIAILVGALAGYFAFGNYGSEAQFVNKGEYQAVFINVSGTNGGLVYFGKVQSITTNYIDLTNVFYINSQTSAGKTTNTLMKLGCEIDAPEDEMLINRAQVYFWNNMKSTSQVSTKIAEYYKNNPNNQNCSSPSSTTQPPISSSTSTDTTSSSSTTGAAASTSSTSGTTKK